MKMATKIWLIIAFFLVAVGFLMFGVVMKKYNWDFSKLLYEKYETNAYEIGEEFSNISINTDTADIEFKPSDNEKCRVECYEEKKAKHSVLTHQDTLHINLINKKSWYDYIGINIDSSKITVYLPKANYTALSIKENTGDILIPEDFKFENIQISEDTGDVTSYASVSKGIKIESDTGDIKVEGISAEVIDFSSDTGDIDINSTTSKGKINIETDTGEINLSSVSCRDFIAKSDTGSILLKNVVATGRLSAESDTGDVKFDGSDGAEIFVKTDTGDVTGTLLSQKVFITESDTGRIRVPKSITGGRCEITTQTGDIFISTP